MLCEFENECLNNTKCHRCFNYKLKKLPTCKKLGIKRSTVSKSNKGTDKSWRDLEQTVANKISNVPTGDEADRVYNSKSFKETINTIDELTGSRRTRRSGALEFEQGDVKDSILHPECKERVGKELKTGEKSMSLKREWLIKAKHECENNNKKMCLPFRFKDDTDIYVIMDFEDLADIVTELKAYKAENIMLKEKLSEWN